MVISQMIQFPESTLEISVMSATNPKFLAPAVLINRRGNNPNTNPPANTAAIAKLLDESTRNGRIVEGSELQRAEASVHERNAHRPVGALAILRGGPRNGLHVAYGYAAEQYLHVDDHPICLRSVCVDPDFRGNGLGAAVAVESLGFYPAARAYNDCVGAASILLAHEFETVHPDVAVKRPAEHYIQTYMGTSQSRPPENAPDLPADPRVEEVIQTIQQAFPSIPPYTVVNRYV